MIMINNRFNLITLRASNLKKSFFFFFVLFIIIVVIQIYINVNGERKSEKAKKLENKEIVQNFINQEKGTQNTFWKNVTDVCSVKCALFF